VTSEKDGQTPIEAYFERLLLEAFERASTGAPGKTPEQVLELMRVHADRLKAMEISPEREAELKRAVSDVDMGSIEDPALRRANAKMAESQQQKLTNVEDIKAFKFTGYRDAPPEDAGLDPEDNGEDPAGGTPPPCPSGP
jgi:hypothetical protein